MQLKTGAIEIEKIVMWALAATILLVILFFLTTNLSTSNEGSLTSRVLEVLFG